MKGKFRVSNTGLSPTPPLPLGSFPTDRSNAVPLLQFFFVRRRFHMWRLCVVDFICGVCAS